MFTNVFSATFAPKIRQPAGFLWLLVEESFLYSFSIGLFYSFFYYFSIRKRTHSEPICIWVWLPYIGFTTPHSSPLGWYQNKCLPKCNTHFKIFFKSISQNSLAYCSDIIHKISRILIYGRCR